MLELSAINQKRLEVLTQTKQFYNSNNRGILNNVCRYLTSDNKKCAVGRLFLTEEELKTFNDTFKDKTVADLQCFEALPNYIKELGIRFLEELQDFHDVSCNWSDEGLSGAGVTNANIIEHKIKTQYYDGNRLY